MNALDLNAEALDFAEAICTPKQMQVLRLRAAGLGHRKIARELLISPSSAKDRLDAAILHLQKAILEREAV